MPTQNINLSEKQARFVRQSIDRGDFRNASEVLRAGLRLLEQQQEHDRIKLQQLRKIAREAFRGDKRGAFVIDDDDDLDRFMELVSARSRTRKAG